MLQFKNMNDLVEYLGKLEERVNKLEEENNRLRTAQPKNDDINKNQVIEYISRQIPKTDLLSPRFFTRAFAVWGHFFMANFIISSIFGILYFCLVMIGLASALGSFQP